VSGGRIRRALNEGRVELACELLGRPFYLRGQVVEGAGRGAGLGIPTLNLKIENELTPKLGVYVTQTVEGGNVYPSVTNVGVNPTFETDGVVRVETHVLDREVNWRGRMIDVRFLGRLRDEMKFSGIEELKSRIRDDIEAARRWGQS
jgi:riboflavin kinase/FMN adenylyltransferase